MLFVPLRSTHGERKPCNEIGAQLNPELRILLETHTNGLVPEIDQLAVLSDYSFEEELYPLWVQVDNEIRGLGLKYAYWREGKLIGYPNTLEFEIITRPLVYVVQNLQQIGTPFLSTRHIVQDIGAHLEGCVKELHGVTQINQTASLRTSLGFLPLGALAKRDPWVRKRLGNTLCRDIVQFCQLAWNPAKHEYRNNGSPDPMIPFRRRGRLLFPGPVPGSRSIAGLGPSGMCRGDGHARAGPSRL